MSFSDLPAAVKRGFGGVIPNVGAFSPTEGSGADRHSSWPLHARFLGPLVKARAFGMTQPGCARRKQRRYPALFEKSRLLYSRRCRQIAYDQFIFVDRGAGGRHFGRWRSAKHPRRQFLSSGRKKCIGC